VLIIPSLDIRGGRSRLVFWPGAATGTGSPTDRPERIARHFAELGAPLIHVVDLDGAAAGSPVNTSALSAIARAVALPLQVAGGVDGPDQIELAFAAGATRVVMPVLAVAQDEERLTACLRIAGDWLAVGLDARPERLGEVAWRTGATPTLEGLAGRLSGAGVRRLVLSHGGAQPDIALLGRLARGVDAEILVAGGVTDPAVLPALRDAGVAGVILGEALLGGAIDYPAAVAAAAA
jgi:phosphoribosylformimino-5-aminoimidazole carboxamide ribotide isomerase